MNPFHVWLGLPEKSANPNHYQLLGIKSSERNVEAIEQAVDERLNRLARVAPNPGQTVALEKIRQRILKAQATLVDKTKRADYDARLREKLAEKKRKKASSASHTAVVAIPSERPEPPRDAQPAEEIPGAEPVASRPAEVVEKVAPEIPMAVPIQAVLPPPLAAGQQRKADQVPVDFSLTNASKDPADLSINKRKFKRKKSSWLVPTFCLVLCLGGIGGLVYLVTNYEAIIGKQITISPIADDPIENPRVANESTIESVPGEDEVDPANHDPRVIPGNLSTSGPAGDGSNDKPPRENAKREKLDFEQQVRFRRHLETARRAMYRRDATKAQNEVRNAQALFTRFERGDIVLDESQASLKQTADAANEIKSLVEGFWQQVVASAVEMPAGQSLEVAGKTLGFVEGNQDFVILRIDGTNATIHYDSLAPGIAMALAEQGAKPDLPTFRLQQAAFYAVHSSLDPKYRDRAIELANEAADDGHDPEPIKQFVNFELAAVGVPEARIAQPPAAEMKDKIPKLMVQLGVVNFRKMRPEQAANAVELTLQAALASHDELEKAMSFEVAYMLAVKAGDVREVVDVLDEYRVWVDFNYAERVQQALLDVAKQRLDERKARLLLNAMIDEAASSEKQQYKQQLLKSAQKVADQHDVGDLLMRLESAAK